MTRRDTQAWRELFGKLCATYDRLFDEAQSRFYFDALKDFELNQLAETAVIVANETKFFPRPAEWRTVIIRRRVERNREATLALAGRRMLSEQCSQCRDTGMRPVDPTAQEERLMACECRDTNENYQRSRARQVLADHGEGTPVIPPAESKRLTDGVLDFKRLGSGGE